MSRLLCWLGFHAWWWESVGTGWAPAAQVRRCRRCGVEA